MKKALLVSAVVCVLGAGGFAFAAGLATKTVNIRSTGFNPQNVTVVGGDTVQWKNLDTVNHQVVANNGAFASPVIRPSGTYAKRMDTPGTFNYHDSLKPSLKGTVKVTGAAPSISTGVTPPITIAGSTVSISGAISPAAVGDTVVIYAQPYPQVSFIEIARVQTTTNGLYGFTHTPSILTAYKAEWKGKTSAVVTTAVAPALTLTKVGSWFVTSAKAAKSFSGRWVYVQRLNQFGQWVSLRKVYLNRQSTQRFKLTLRPGISRIRIYLTTNQAGAGYVFNSSRVLTVRR
ncbi:MAG: cupredoxin domain-containing protein [Actinobacteria bacterium]|nr:cupredoxin domain-containing protein [Actinomycetota bacterium]